MKRTTMAMIVLVTIVACSDPRNPQNKTEENIYHSADKMTEAFLKRDWPTFTHFINPRMISKMGGDAVFQSNIATQMKEVPDTALKKLEIRKILQVATTPHDVQCVVEQYLLMSLQGTQVTSTTYLVGESLDNGKNWTFFDASNTGLLKPIDIKPDLSPELNIPAKKQQLQ